jgi:hypothetical protein
MKAERNAIDLTKLARDPRVESMMGELAPAPKRREAAPAGTSWTGYFAAVGKAIKG